MAAADDLQSVINDLDPIVAAFITAGGILPERCELAGTLNDILQRLQAVLAQLQAV